MTDIKPDDIRHPDGTITRQGKRWGCHLELDFGQAPDGCVAMDGDHSHCDFGYLRPRVRRSTRWTCPHWKEITEASE